MKYLSFNINGLRARLEQLATVLETHAPEVLALQETKVDDPAFPREAVEALGYHVAYFGQKGHYGVATLTKAPPEAICYGFPGDNPEAQRRFIGVTVPFGSGSLRVLNGYFPQGESRSHPTKFPAKAAFYEALQAYLEAEEDPTQPLMVVGDFNIAPQDEDIGIGPDNQKRWLRTGKTSFLPEERAWFDRLLSWGLTDSYRARYPDVQEGALSWFDYRSRGFEATPKRGLRIDHILLTAPLMAQLEDAGVDQVSRALPRPSDHCPVWVSLRPPETAG